MNLFSFFNKSPITYDIFDNFPDAIIVINYQKNIVYWNKKAKYIFEYSFNDVKNENIGLIFSDNIEKIYQTLASDKGSVLAARKKSGEEFFVEIFCANSEIEGEFVISARDVTANKKLIENLVLEREKIAQVSQNKSSFIANLSHELRTPMHSIIGFSQALLDGLGSELNEKQEKYVSIISRNANNLLALMNSILDISKIEAGKMEFNYKGFDVMNLVNSCIETVMPMVEQKKLEFSTDFTDVVKRHIYSDETLLRQILLNILGNAVKFTDLGSIRLKISHPDIESLNYHEIEIEKDMNDKSYLLFSISDTGIGIPEGELDNIFDEYRQLDKSISKKYGGTGLGLATSKKLLQGLKGSIWVESEVGIGSTFNFIIPIERVSVEIKSEEIA